MNEIQNSSTSTFYYTWFLFAEVLRKHPIVSTLTRMCTKDYKVPGSNVTIDKGVAVFISVLGIHYDEEFYPNPDVLDPERFNEENKAKRPSCTFLPFGEGPRNCIGVYYFYSHNYNTYCIVLF